MLYGLHQRVSSPETIVGAESGQACGMGDPAEQRQRKYYGH
jgi:hypothetical protein